MQAGKEVHEKIAGDAGSVILIISPAEETDRIELHFRSVSQECVPIDCRRTGIAGNGVLPCATAALAVIPGFNQYQVTDGFRGYDLAGFFGYDGAYSLAANLVDPSRFLLRRNDGGAFFQFVDHWFFTIHMFAFVHGVDGDAVMPMVGCGNYNRVNIFAVENFMIVLRGEDILSKHFFGTFKPAGVKI